MENKKILSLSSLEVYLNQGLSAYEISILENVSHDYIRRHIKKYNLIENFKCNICNTSENLYFNGKSYTNICNECRLAKIKKTKLERYGDENYCNKEKINETKLTNIDENGLNSFERGKLNYQTTMIERYGVTSNFHLQETKEKRQQTWLENYGVDHPQKSVEIQEKYKNTCLERYGVENAAQCEVVKNKQKNTMIERYGVPHNYLLYNNGYSKNSQDLFWFIYNNISSKLKKSTYFAELNKEYFLNFNTDLRKKTGISNQIFKYDFCIKDLNLFIEFNGSYWHNHPEFIDFDVISDDDFLSIYRGWHKDNVKKQYALDNGFSILTLWEHEYFSNQKSKILSDIFLIIDKLNNKQLNKIEYTL